MQKNTPNKVDHLLVEHVIAAVKKAESKEDALQKCINEVCTQLEWPIGHAYFPASLWHGLDPSKVRFCAKPDQYNVFRDITETTPCDIDADLPGRVLKTKKPEWIPDVTKDTNFPRANRAENIGVKAAFAFPVTADSEVIAVLEFFHPLAIEPDGQILDGMGNIGKQVGKAIQDIQFETPFRNVKQMQQTVASREEQFRNSIRPEKLDDCIKWIETIWKEVLRLNSYIHCIKRITEFPFGSLQHNPSPFWTLIKESMCDSLEMVINRITDKSSNTLTLKKFKDEIVVRFIKEEYKERFNKTWDVLFEKIDTDDTDIKNTLKKLRHRRNKIIAHHDIDFNINASDEDIKKWVISLPEIYNLTKYLNTLFVILMLNSGHILRRTDPGTDFSDLNYTLDAKDPSSDIETLLDTIAKESAIMNMPEKDPEKWLQYRKNLNDRQIETFNKYRKKFDLPRVE